MDAILRKPPGGKSRILGCGNLDVRVMSKLLNLKVFWSGRNTCPDEEGTETCRRG